MVDDVKQNNFRDKAGSHVYFPLVGPEPRSWVISSPAYVIKTPRAETIAPEVRAIVREMAPRAPMYRVFTMAGLASDSMTDLSFTMLTLGVASSLALVLGAVGLYGVLSYIVAQRTREIGVRMALGARAGQVRRMVVLQGARVVIVGVVIGVAFALWMTSALGSLLFGVGPWTRRRSSAMSAVDDRDRSAGELRPRPPRVESRSGRVTSGKLEKVGRSTPRALPGGQYQAQNSNRTRSR